MNTARADKQFEAFLEYPQSTRGFDFTVYQRPSLMCWITKPMQMIKTSKEMVCVPILLF